MSFSSTCNIDEQHYNIPQSAFLAGQRSLCAPASALAIPARSHFTTTSSIANRLCCPPSLRSASAATWPSCLCIHGCSTVLSSSVRPKISPTTQPMWISTNSKPTPQRSSRASRMGRLSIVYGLHALQSLGNERSKESRQHERARRTRAQVRQRYCRSDRIFVVSDTYLSGRVHGQRSVR